MGWSEAAGTASLKYTVIGELSPTLLSVNGTNGGALFFRILALPALVSNFSMNLPADDRTSSPFAPHRLLPAGMKRSVRSHRSPSSQSIASSVGAGQWGARLFALAPSSARYLYLDPFDTFNDEFAAQLRQRGVPQAGGESRLLYSMCLFPPFPSLFSSRRWHGTFPLVRLCITLPITSFTFSQ